MKFFLDTANIDEIRNAAESRLIDRVTTLTPVDGC
jgi:hypothetical protein